MGKNPDTNKSPTSDELEPFWEYTLDKLEDWQAQSILGWIESPEQMVEDFDPNDPPKSATSKVGELTNNPLLGYGDDDSPYYETIGILWDEIANLGRVYYEYIDGLRLGSMIDNMETESVWKIVLEALTRCSPSSAAQSLPDLDSLVFNPHGFQIYDHQLVPRNEVDQLIRTLYNHFPSASIREENPTPESWLAVVYG